MSSEIRILIIDSLKFYIEEMTRCEDDMDMLFDESYFLFLLNTRYSERLLDFKIKELYQQIEKRRQWVLFSLKQSFDKKRNCLANKNLFEKSQFWFNFIGFCYLESLDTTDYSVLLTNEELGEIERGYGYSATYDYMMTFFLQKLNQNSIQKKGSITPSKNERIYVATHKFLLESDYFSRKITVEANSEELFIFLEDVLVDPNKDLLAEIVWALNYFSVGEFPQRQEVESILENHLWTSRNNGMSREERHTIYACILSFLEKDLEVADKHV